MMEIRAIGIFDFFEDAIFKWSYWRRCLGYYNYSVVVKMLKDKVLTAKSFLKTPELRQKYECWICYQICIKPVKCRGSCGHIFCMKCVSDTRNNNHDRCPSRCSSPFLVVPLPDIVVQFYCPYNPTECQILINSLNLFEEHYKICPFVSPEELYYKKLQSQYKCLKQHYLQFYVGSYEEMINSKCCQCGEQKVCRSFCRICQQFYCVSCRVPPCCKESCPIGHPFSFQRIGVINYICDVCGISTAVSGGGVYDDNRCNFGLCESCFKQLPEKYDQSKPRSIVANVNTLCSCGSKLVQVNSSNQRQTCELCKKVKQCPRFCTNCEKRYCIGCKLFDIYSDMTCLEDHGLIRVTSQNSGLIESQNDVGCMRCGHQRQTYFVDDKCFVRLCQQCFVYSMKVTTDKERPISLTCDKNHVLNYINQEEEYLDNCCKCSKVKQIRLVCITCEEDERLYCFQCKPIPLRTCYFRHKLKFQRFAMPRQCQFCRQMADKLFCCRKCAFYVCRECVSLTLNGQKMVEESGPSIKMEEEL